MLKKLTVKDLIDELSKHPPQTKIYRPLGGVISGVRSVELIATTSSQCVNKSEMVILIS